MLTLFLPMLKEVVALRKQVMVFEFTKVQFLTTTDPILNWMGSGFDVKILKKFVPNNVTVVLFPN